MFRRLLYYFVSHSLLRYINCISKTKYSTFLSSFLKNHCKIYFTINLMSPDQIRVDIILADKVLILIGIEVTIDLFPWIISNVIVVIE